MWARRCFILPWHKPDPATVQRVSDNVKYYRCTCGREWALNYAIHGVLAWDDVAELYADDKINEQTGWRRPVRAV